MCIFSPGVLLGYGVWKLDIPCDIMLFNLFRCVLVLSLVGVGISLQPQIGIGAVFDSEHFNHYNSVFYRAFQENNLLIKHNISIAPIATQHQENNLLLKHNISIKPLTTQHQDNIYSSMNVFCSFIESRDIKVLFVVGRQSTIQSVSQVAEPLGIPILGYTTDTVVGKFVQVSFYNFKLRDLKSIYFIKYR